METHGHTSKLAREVLWGADPRRRGEVGRSGRRRESFLFIFTCLTTSTSLPRTACTASGWDFTKFKTHWQSTYLSEEVKIQSVFLDAVRTFQVVINTVSIPEYIDLWPTSRHLNKCCNPCAMALPQLKLTRSLPPSNVTVEFMPFISLASAQVIEARLCRGFFDIPYYIHLTFTFLLAVILLAGGRHKGHMYLTYLIRQTGSRCPPLAVVGNGAIVRTD